MNEEEALEWCIGRNDIEIRFLRHSVIARLKSYPADKIILSRQGNTLEQAVTRLAEAIPKYDFSE